MKKLISLIMAVLMLVAMFPAAAFAANESSNSFALNGGSVEVDGSEDKTVTVVFSSTSKLQVVGINGSCDIEPADGISLSEFTVPWTVNASNPANVSTGMFGYADDANFAGFESAANASIVTMTYTVDKNMAAGTYPVSFTLAEYCNEDYLSSFLPQVSAQTYTANITVTNTANSGGNEGDSTDGYTVSVNAATTNVNNDGNESNVTVNVNVNKAFNSAVIKLSYDAALLNYVGYTLAEGQSLPANDPIEVNAAVGVITIRDYGAGYVAGDAYTLNFTSIKGGNATVAVTSAACSTKENAETQDLTPATAGSSASVTIKHKVTITDTDTSSTTYDYVAPGASYNFQIPNYSANFTYTVDVIGGTKTDNGSGSYTISGITGAVTITYSKTAVTYDVTWIDTYNLIADGEEKSPVNAGEDIVFYLPKNIAVNGTQDGTNYLVTVTRGAATVTPTITIVGEQQKVVIAGADVTAALTIEAYSEVVPATETTITIEDSNEITLGGNAVTGTITVNKGEDLNFVLGMEDGYTYKVEQFIGEATTGTVLTVNEETGAFTVSVGDQPITIRVTKTLDTNTLEVSQYVQLNGTKMWLVKINGLTDTSNKTYTYDGTEMFWSSKYQAYCYLIVSASDPYNNVDETAKAAFKAKFALSNTAAVSISYNGNVNLSKDANDAAVIDVNDAQLVWNMYSAVYTGFDNNVTVQKFLEADMDSDAVLSTNDAAQVVAKIQ